MNDSIRAGIIPHDYYIAVIECKCEVCGMTFVFRRCRDESLVKFKSSSGTGEAWLPTYGNDGYLALLEQLIPGFDLKRQQIIEPIVRRFEIEFQTIQVPPAKGGWWILDRRCICPNCSTTNVKQLHETILHNPELSWIRYRSPKSSQ
jgi:hypothetical protein